MWEYEVICMYSQLSEAEEQQNGEEPVGELQNAAASWAELRRLMRCDAMR